MGDFQNISTNTLLVLSLLLSTFTMLYMYKRRKESTLFKYSFYLVLCVFILDMLMVLQRFCMNILPIAPVYYEYIAYFGACYIAPLFLMVSMLYNNSNINMKKYNFLFIIPTISILTLWTNDLHHLFFVNYTIDIYESVTGPAFVLHTIYSYACLLIAMFILIKRTLHNSGFFSIQTLLIILAVLIPTVPNILSTFKLIDATVYLTPTLFGFTAVVLSLAIIKYKALNITPVAFKTVIDTMSDGFIVISNDGTIADMNRTFKDTLSKVLNLNKDGNLYKSLEDCNLIDINDIKKHIKDASKNKKILSEEYHIIQDNFDRYYQVDINPIKAAKAKNEIIGSLLLFKDITQHKLDLKTISENQEIIATQGQLAIIGELAGGMAHDINTPISAIKTGVEILKTEPYISDNIKDTVAVIDRCTEKIINIVNSMRNQMRNLGSNEKTLFDLQGVINDIVVITKNELIKNNCKLNINIKENIRLTGEPIKLSQVIMNLIINAMQAYENKGGDITLSLYKEDDMAIIEIQDMAGGIDEKVKSCIFKNILTTKGISGTGLGLYLAHSIIKGDFGGKLTFQTEDGVGTTFIIKIPIII